MFSPFIKHFHLLVLWGVMCAVVAGGVSLFFPRSYSAESQVLIISRDRTGVDPYTQAKSAERTGGNLAQVMQTTDFYSKVVEAVPGAFNDEVWQKLSDRDRRKKWKKDVVGESVFGSSLLKITTFSETPAAAAALSKAITDTLVTRGWEYVGGDVIIKQVDTPLVSSFPKRPNFVLNFLVGGLVGVMISGLWIFRYRSHRVFGKM